MKKYIALLMVLFCTKINANNIQVSNLSLTDENRLEGHVTVQFDLTWENSWRLSSGPSNWDAAWVFMKYRVGNGEWKHAKLNNTGHTMGSGTPSTHTIGLLNDDAAFDATNNPCVGMFVYRSEASSGTFTNTGVKLRWNYGANGIGDGVSIDVKVFAIEMVYVAQGAYYVGGGGGTYGFTTTNINTANASTTPSGGSGGYPAGQSVPVSTWPNGFDAAYCMKYEISHQQYVDFLNTLTQSQANNQSTGVNGTRYDISGNSPGNFSTSLAFVACYIPWWSATAYADWACLRPMTEMEFEKFCRGPLTPVNSEYAWGTTSRAVNPYALSSGGQGEESISANYSVSAGNANYLSTSSTVNGPMRVGIFSANASNTGRIASGSSYWGIMELSGNLHERCVTLSNAAGRAFTGVHGDGMLDSSGYANVSQWPGTNATGIICRGGSWNDPEIMMRVSDRSLINNTDNWISLIGFRAVRGL